MLAELVGAVKGGVVPARALGQALHDLERLVTDARSAGASLIRLYKEAKGALIPEQSKGLISFKDQALTLLNYKMQPAVSLMHSASRSPQRRK